jgi:TetR/AcrR family transcriptional regulator, regulator of cefoperazone and chloramphenicol sensitivity
VPKVKQQPSDLTAYARIRNAALKLFGEKGPAATSIREVARAARVSPGLVQHHFRNKSALESAVSAYVADKMAQLAGAGLEPGRTAPTLTLGAAVIGFIRRNPELVAYLRRVILEDDRVGHHLLDSIVQLSRTLNRRLQANHLLRRDLDPVWTPLNTMILVLGPLLLEPSLNRYLDHRLRSEKGLARWDAAVEDLYLRGIYRHPPGLKRRGASVGSR